MSCRLMKAGLGIGLALAAVASAEVPLRDYAGREVGWHDARGLAAGGLGGLFPGPGAAFANPAVLGFLTRPAVTLGYGMEVASEERTRIVYDRFENTLAEAGIADNTSAHGLAGPAVGAVRLGPVGIGAGVAPVRAFGYSYLKEYRDDFYVKFGEDRVEQSGAVYAANLGLGFSPFGPLSAGARAGYLFGTRRLEVEAWRGPDTSRYVEEGNPSGIGYAAGLAVRPARMLCVGLDYEGGVTYSSWLTGDALPPEAVTDRSFPWAGRLALAWQIPGPLPAVADAELRYLAWHAVDSTCGNILLARAGVEHLMLNFLRLRYGLGVEPLPFDPTVQVALFGFGLGFDVGRLNVDAGMLLGRSVIGPDLFRVVQPLADLKSYESRSTFAITVTREF